MGKYMVDISKHVPRTSDTPFFIVQIASNVYSHDTLLRGMLDEFTTIVLWLALDSKARCAWTKQLGETIFILAVAGLVSTYVWLLGEEKEGKYIWNGVMGAIIFQRK